MRIKLDEGAFPVLHAHETDAGYDLRTREEKTIPAHGSAVFDTGVHIELPHGYYAQLQSKSGLNVKHGIVCLGGTIDEPYRGSIVVKLYNLSDEDYTFEVGDKIVQMVLMPYHVQPIEYVDDLTESDRGENGFGSTGR